MIPSKTDGNRILRNSRANAMEEKRFINDSQRLLCYIYLAPKFSCHIQIAMATPLTVNEQLLLKHIRNDSVITSVGLTVAIGALAFISILKSSTKWHVLGHSFGHSTRGIDAKPPQKQKEVGNPSNASSSCHEAETPVFRTWSDLQPKTELLLEEFDRYLPDLPNYSASEIARHNQYESQSNNNNSSVWLSYKKSVLDITEYVSKHPGGDIILQGAGKSVDYLFEIYAQHKTYNVLLLLKQYRIGNFLDDRSSLEKFDDPYVKEPQRNPALQLLLPKPFNCCPPPSMLMDSFITPADLVYVRSHLPIPNVNVEDYELHVIGPNTQAKLKLAELKTKFPIARLMAVLSCSGNRRREMNQMKKTCGPKFDHGAIGNCYWTGVYLRDVLLHLGLDENSGKHVHFDSLDIGVDGEAYTLSFPIEMCFDPKREILLAFEQNDQPLLPDHGFPLRLFIPGTIGARCVKWLGKIRIEEEESRSRAHRVDNKLYPPYATWDTADFEHTPVIYDHVVNSAICLPENGQTVRLIDGKIYLKGYAWSGGGKKIVRVDITCDDGKSFIPATLIPPQERKFGKAWAWYWWEAYLPVPKKDTTHLKVACRAMDSSYMIQPENVRSIWNIFGEFNNAYHRVDINIEC